MKILIITNNYLQKSVISSKRWRCFSKYLSEYGHDVTVVCGDDESYKGDSFTIDELRNERLNIFKYSSMEPIFVLFLKVIRILKGRKQPLPHSSGASAVYLYLAPLSFFAYVKSYFLCWVETLIYEQFCFSKFRKSKILNKIGKLKFDAIVASCGPLDSIILGEKIHNHFKGIPYYTEFRDMLHSRMYLNKAQNDFYINYEKKHVDIADGTFVVSNGQKEMLCESICTTTDDIMNKIFVLYHGFDSKMNDLVASLSNNDASNSKLIITYTGTLDPAVEDPRMLFHALSMLINEGAVVENKIQIVYVGLGYDCFEDSARAYKLDSIISYEGFVTPVEAVQYQSKSDILLLLADNSRFQKGILGGKFSEYISIRKPLIALTVGDLAGAEITSLINEMNIGVACEYVDYNKSINELKMFLLLKYNEKLKNGYLEITADEEKIYEFSYEALTKKLICILRNNN